MAKLVEILARELREWPEGQDSAWQSAFDLEIYFEGTGWQEMVYATEAAEDRGYPDDGVGVTREMWEVERAKLAGKDSGAPEPGFNRGEPGMDLRDYFAAKAMQAYLTLDAELSWPLAVHADSAYKVADAMLAARSK